MAEPWLTLLIAVPLSVDEIVRAAANDSDYARSIAADPYLHWTRPNGYRETVVEPFQALAVHVERVGGRVVQGAGREDLAAATANSEVVVVLAHWKGALITDTDVQTPDGNTLADALEATKQRDLAAVGPALRRSRLGDRRRLARLLNKTMERLSRQPTASDDAPSDFSVVMHRNTALSRARVRLDHALSGHIAAGERLELTSGLHDAGTVNQSIAPSFRGVLDLTTCTSMRLADQIDRWRHGSFRIVQFEQLLPPAIAALALRRTLDLMSGSCRPQDYLAARRRAVPDVAGALEKAALERLQARGWFRWRNRATRE